MSGGGKSKGGGGPRRRKLISEDDRALWDMVARRFEPARGKSRVRDVEPDHELLGDAIDPPQRGKRTVDPPPASVAPPAPQRKSPPAPSSRPGLQPVELDRRKARRIARGTEEIEARLDLHGMTQDDAHTALIGFVRRCHANGLRTVLVITGKGGAGRGSRDDDDVVPRPRGVLKRNVPRWLGGPEIGGYVISTSTAHARHGGDGALYVRLRRQG